MDSADAGSAPVLDRTISANMEALIGREKFELALTKFRADLSNRVEEICRCEAKAEDIRANAHKLVGTAGMMGFTQLSDYASELENAICRGSSDLAPLVSAVRAAAERAMSEIELLCSS